MLLTSTFTFTDKIPSPSPSTEKKIRCFAGSSAMSCNNWAATNGWPLLYWSFLQRFVTESSFKVQEPPIIDHDMLDYVIVVFFRSGRPSRKNAGNVDINILETSTLKQKTPLLTQVVCRVQILWPGKFTTIHKIVRTLRFFPRLIPEIGQFPNQISQMPTTPQLREVYHRGAQGPLVVCDDRWWQVQFCPPVPAPSFIWVKALRTENAKLITFLQIWPSQGLQLDN